MVQLLATFVESPSQTAGPYVHIGCKPAFAGLAGIYAEDVGESPIRDGAKGEIVTISGRVFDGTGWAMRDALLESWQADAAGHFPGQSGADPAVTGFCRFVADGDSGEFTLRTVKPGPVPMADGGVQSPHIAIWIVARGINIGLSTRLYFDDEDNSGDPLLSRIEQAHRKQTLIAQSTGHGTYQFNIRLQGEGETVFLDM